MAFRNQIHAFSMFMILVITCHAMDDQRGAFVQTGEELHFFVDAQQYWTESVSSRLLADGRPPFGDPRSPPRSGSADRRSHTPGVENENNSNQSVNDDSNPDDVGALNQLKFEPSSLEFGFQAIGVPEQKKVKVTNPTASKVRFDAISGSTVHFHCSFFDEKTIEPGSSTTFDVVFLPRQEGQLRTTLSIHSSLGAFQYIVSGVGTSNPYRLRPFVGARVPLNGTFIGPLEMHNPHPTTLRVVEMYTSGGDLHVDLPVQGSGDGVQSRSVWEIPPFQTRTVGKARYIGARVKNATAYIRIKTDLDYPDDGYGNGGRGSRQQALIVPVEIEVTAKAGLYAAVDRLDFGTIVEGEQSRWVILEIYNTHNRTVDISSIESDSQSILVDFRPVVSLISNTRSPTYVAKFAYDASKNEPAGQRLRSGRLMLKSRDGRYALSVPYSVQVLEGRLIHDPGEVAFYNGQRQQKSLERNITLWNVFDTPVAVYNISLPKSVRRMFKVQNFNSPVIIPARSSMHVFALLFNSTAATLANIESQSTSLESRFRLHTNISRFDIPLHLFDGNLRFTLYSIDQSEFDFGILDVGQERYILFAVTNENPIPVTIKNMTNVMPSYTTLELMGVEEGNHSVLSYDHSPSEYKWRAGEDFTVPARSFAVFRFAVMAPHQRAVYHGRMIFKTAFQTVEFPVAFSVDEGSVISVPEKVVIDDAFPGKISSHAVQVFSTFPREMPLLRLSTLSNDPRFFFESLEKEQSPIIKPAELARLGRVFFMPVATCLDDCYVGLPLNTDDGRHWIRGMRLPADLPEVDVYLYRKLRSKWDAIVERGEHIANSTIMVDSTEIKNFPINVEGHLVWPRLMKQSAVHFPLTAVGNYTIVNVTLQNPSNLPVAVQLLPLTIYPGPYDLIKMLGNDIASPLTSYVEVDDVLIFSLRDSELYNARPESPVPHLRQELERIVGIQIPRFTLSMLLQPGMKVRVRIGFLPPDYQLRSTMLLLRNNLTVLETVTLYGRGGKLELRIGTKLPNTKQPLLFEIQDKHLKECENLKRLQHKLPTSLTVRRSFVARNTGELPLHIVNMSLSGHACHGRGFRILNCEPFRLQPNETHVLEIAFTPDFTLSWFEAYLQLYIGGTVAPLNYAIGVSLPREWLPKCQAALPRPYWEPLMYYSCVTALGFLLICVIASAYLEGDRIITCALAQYRANQRRVFEMNGYPRPFSFRHPHGMENGTGPSVDAGVQDHSTDDNVFDNDSDTGNGEKPKSLPYRLIMLFYYLITKRRFSIARSGETDSNQDDTSSTSGKMSTSHVAVSGRPARTTLSMPPSRIQETTVNHQNAESKSRRSSSGQSMHVNDVGQSNRKSSDDSTSASVKRPPPSHTPPNQQNDRKTSAGKGMKKRHVASFQPVDTTPVKNGKENFIIFKEELKPIKTEIPPKSRGPVQSQHSPIDHESGLRRRVPLLDKENRKSDSENQQRKSENASHETPPPPPRLRGRSSREVSESEPDDRTNRKQTSKSERPPKSKSTVPESAAFSKYLTKPDNRETAAALKGHANKSENEEERRFVSPTTINGGQSESEELPEWDQASLPGAGEHQNIDDAFDQLASATRTFAASDFHQPKPAQIEKTGKRQHLLISTAGPAAVSKLGASTNLPSPTGNESVLSSTSRSDSISSLDASESSSPSPDEARRNKAKKTMPTSASSSDAGQRKKKSVTIISALATSPKQHQRIQKSPPVQSQPVQQKKPTIMASQILPPRSSVDTEFKEIPHSSAGAIGEGRKEAAAAAALAQAQQQMHQPSNQSIHQKSIMQQLREDRMRRLQEHILRKMQAGEEWPGFDAAATGGESLWDEDHDPWRSGLMGRGADEKKPPSDIWGPTPWSPMPPPGLPTPGGRPSSTENPFPSFFDIPVGQQTSDWPTQSLGAPASPTLNSLEENQSFGSRVLTPPPPVDSSIVAWGPPVAGPTPVDKSAYGMDMTHGQMHPSTWTTSGVMTGFDIPWPKTLLKDENKDEAASGSKQKK